MDGRTLGFVLATVFTAARVCLVAARVRLYRRHAATFDETDGDGLRQTWREVLARSGHSFGGLLVFSLATVGLAALAAFQPRLGVSLGESMLGAVVIWCASTLCVETQYLVNRRLVLANPDAARRTAAHSPRSGLVMEALVAAYVFVPVAAAAGVVRAPFLIGGAIGAGWFLLVRVVRVFTRARQVRRPL